jgi:hydrogenase nickel incorporation protein HypA/HybF
MHELSIAQSVIQIVEKSMPSDFNKQISYVHLQIGQLSGIEIDALEFAFSIMKEKSKIPFSQLVIEKLNGEARCNNCGYVFAISSYGESCPDCNNFDIAITKGKEMKVIRIEATE